MHAVWRWFDWDCPCLSTGMSRCTTPKMIFLPLREPLLWMRSWVRSSTSSLIRYCVYLYYSTWYIHLYTDCTRVYRLYACIQTHMLYTSFIYMYSIRIVSIVHRSMHVLIAIGFRMLHVHVDGKCLFYYTVVTQCDHSSSTIMYVYPVPVYTTSLTLVLYSML